MHDHTLHPAFSSLLFTSFYHRKKIKCHIYDCIKINGKQMIQIPKTVNMLYSKIMKGN